jgi:hypothetical protein
MKDLEVKEAVNQPVKRVVSADLDRFIDKYQPSKFKRLSKSIEVRGVNDLEGAMNKARQLILDLKLKLVVINDAEMASYKAFEVREGKR